MKKAYSIRDSKDHRTAMDFPRAPTSSVGAGIFRDAVVLNDAISSGNAKREDNVSAVFLIGFDSHLSLKISAIL